MEDTELTFQQVLSFRPVQEALNENRASSIEVYRRIIKHNYTAELKQLMRTEFDMVGVELKLPQLPQPINKTNEAEKSTLQLDKMVELFDSAMEGMSLL